MADLHLLQGLMKWAMRGRWSDRLFEALDDHLQPVCDETELDRDDIFEALGEEKFMSTVWLYAFEDLLTRVFDDGSNIVDDYLKRRRWKETASARAYMAALRNSAMSVYEVSDIVPDTSFRARDLVRGGEPILINDRVATGFILPSDRVAMRVVRVGSQTLVGGALLHYEHEASERLIGSLRELANLGTEEKQAFADTLRSGGLTGSPPADHSETTMRGTISPLFTAVWLVALINRAEPEEDPELDDDDLEDDDIVSAVARYPFAAGATEEDIRSALKRCPELRQDDATYWSWVSPAKPAGVSALKKKQSPPKGPSETAFEHGWDVFDGLELEDGEVVLRVSSGEALDRASALLGETLGELVGQPVVVTEFTDLFF
jgi:hypothetical protein